jgi:hypothetical protein
MDEIDHFNFFLLYSDYLTTDMNNLHVKTISFSYIIIENTEPEYKDLAHPNEIA